MTTIFLFIAILAVLVLVHEFGHFLVAKRSGARVEEFGFGFPPRILGVKKGETLYSLNLFPIGGFVKIYGEDGLPAEAGLQGEARSDPRSFTSKSVATRAFIIGAGVAMNILLAAALFSVGHYIGLPQVLDEELVPANVKNVQVHIADVAKDSPAEQAGIAAGDVVLSMRSGEAVLGEVKSIEEVQRFTQEHLMEEIVLIIKHNGDILQKDIVPRASPPPGEGAMGIAMLRTGTISYPFYLAPLKGIESTALLAAGTVKAFVGILADLFRTGELREDLAGPVGIAVLTAQVQKMGFIFLLQFIALISVNLAIINILPFPALDGGRLLFLAIEKIKGSPVNQRYEKMAHTIGFALLVFLMIVITFRDIGRFL